MCAFEWQAVAKCVNVFFSNSSLGCVSSCLCSKRGFDVRSFGTGSHVKLPGPAPDKPNVYDFKTTYEQMYNDLVRKDKELYPGTQTCTLTYTHTCTKTYYS